MRQTAIAELIHILKSNPRGIRLQDLQGTNRFHGMRTLTLRQSYHCLKSIPNVSYRCDGGSMYAHCFWFIKE
jgi:hypothetical protein